MPKFLTNSNLQLQESKFLNKVAFGDSMLEYVLFHRLSTTAQNWKAEKRRVVAR